MINLHRLGLAEIAEPVLESITEEMEIIENFAYHDLLLMFKGLKPEAELLGDEGDAIQNATLGYGIAVWLLINGEHDEAMRRLNEILESEQWAAFGYIAAEAEIARLRR